MNREIKFRGKQKSWIYGGISIFENEATIFDVNCVANSAYEVDIKSVGQFTGFIDSQKNEIYEGDIIKINNSDFTYKVVFEKGCFFLFHLKTDWGKWGCLSRIYDADLEKLVDKIRIIGNVYENTELLNS